MPDLKITDIMTKEVVSVDPEMPLFEAAKILSEHNFDGMPVVDKNNRLIGILTEYDLISKSSSIHLPTLQKILGDVRVFGKDKSQFKSDFSEILSLKVEDAMNKDPLVLKDDAAYDEAIRAFREHHRVNPIPIVDGDRQVVGVISRYDVLKPLEKLV